MCSFGALITNRQRYLDSSLHWYRPTAIPILNFHNQYHTQIKSFAWQNNLLRMERLKRFMGITTFSGLYVDISVQSVGSFACVMIVVRICMSRILHYAFAHYRVWAILLQTALGWTTVVAVPSVTTRGKKTARHKKPRQKSSSSSRDGRYARNLNKLVH